MQSTIVSPPCDQEEILSKIERERMDHNNKIFTSISCQDNILTSDEITEKRHRGYLILIPSGCNIQGWISQLSNEEQKIWLDGDDILDKEDIENRNIFWYDEKYKQEIKIIIAILEKYIVKGYNILYSGNPILIHPDVIIIPSKEDRWKRLRELLGCYVSKQRFDHEEKIYYQGKKKIPHIITPTCLIPSPDYISKFINKIRSRRE